MAIQRAAHTCVEFCELIEYRSRSLDRKIRSLMDYVDVHMNRGYDGCLDNVADSIESQIDEIWNLVKVKNFEERPVLCDLYSEIIRDLWLHYEARDSISFQSYYRKGYDVFSD